MNKQGYAGANKEISVFGPRTRRYSNNRGWLNPQYADLSCQPNDRFTPTDARSGNKAMKYLIGLIALDEVLMGGGFGGQANANYYLYTGQDYWTVSPSQFVSNGDVGVEQVKVDGNIGASDATYVEGVRPVINLKANTTFSKGDGSINLPYEVI